MKISVILPVYNTGKYLADALDSVLAQNVEGMEIIAVNDCSTDNSLAILQNHAASHDIIRVIDLENNVGSGEARNIGMDQATGDWIAFLDSDDLMQPGSLPELLKTAVGQNADIVLGNVKRRRDNIDGSCTITDYKTAKNFEFVLSNTNLRNFPSLINVPPCWALLYRTAFLRDNRIKYRRRIHEDHDFVLHVLLEAENVCIRGDVDFVHYRFRNNDKDVASNTNSPWSEERFRMFVDHIETVYDLLHTKAYETKLGAAADYLRTHRMSYYLGKAVNGPLRHVLGRPGNEFQESLERLAAIFGKSGLPETGLDLTAETLQNRPKARQQQLLRLCACT